MLVLKTNNYLRAIDKRLGNPTNSFYVINDVTWRVFKSEVKVGRWLYLKEGFRYYWLKFWLTMYRVKLIFMHMFGIKASDEELEDFDVDIV